MEAINHDENLDLSCLDRVGIYNCAQDFVEWLRRFFDDFRLCFNRDLRDKIVFVQTDKCATLQTNELADLPNTPAWISEALAVPPSTREGKGGSRRVT